MKAFRMILLGGVNVVGMMLTFAPFAHGALSAGELLYESTKCEASISTDPQVRSEIEGIRSIFERAGLGASNSQFGSGKDFHGVDEIFTPPDLGPMALLKLCLKPKDPSFTQHTIQLEDGFLFHGKTAHQLHYAVFFSGLERDQALELSAALNSIGTTASPKRPLLDLLIPSAYAGRNEAFHNPRKKRLDSEKSSNHRDILAATASCGVGLGKGVLAATVVPAVGIVKSTVRFIEGVAFSVRKPKEAWSRVVSRVKELSGVIKGFSLSRELKGLKGKYDNLPFRKKVEVICAVASAIGTSAALSLFVSPMLPANIVLIGNILSAAGLADTVKDYLIPPAKGLPDQPISNQIDRLMKSLESLGGAKRCGSL